MRSKPQKPAELRVNLTKSQALLWQMLRTHRGEGLKFDRMHPLGDYVAEFYCASHKIVIELTDAVTAATRAQDPVRAAYFAEHGMRVVTVQEADLEKNLEAVWAQICGLCVRK